MVRRPFGTGGCWVLRAPVRPDVLETLCCPVGKKPLRVMAPRELHALNARITQGCATYATGERVADALEDGLATADGTAAYRVRDGVPILLPAFRITWSAGGTPVGPAVTGANQSGLWADRWEELSRRWNEMGPPVRPARQDTDLLQRVTDQALADAGRAAPRVLVLGVTPEIATMRWPARTRLLALDSSEAMIRNVWPAREVTDGTAALADWLAMPVRDGAYDLIVGDGSLSVPRHPEGSFALVREMRRVLKDDGALAMRMFTRPETTESLESIFSDLRNGRIGSLDFLKWRLVMALHGDLTAGTRMGDVWDAWQENVPDPGELMRSLGWPPEAPRILEGLRGMDARLTFPTLREARAALSREFVETACMCPDYETGNRYPTVLLRPKPRTGGSPPA